MGRNVDREELEKMDAESDRCAAELPTRESTCSDMLTVAIMSMGKGYHCQSEQRLEEVTAREGAPAPVVTSAGALVHGLRTLGARRIAMVAPYMQPLCTMVADYIAHEGFEVADMIALEIPDNLEVGRRDPLALVDIYKRLTLEGVDALVLSSCVQMPSLAAIPIVEREAASGDLGPVHDLPDDQKSAETTRRRRALL